MNSRDAESARYRVVFLRRDAGLAADDEVTLLDRSLLPAGISRFHALAESTSYRLGLCTGEDRAVVLEALP